MTDKLICQSTVKEVSGVSDVIEMLYISDGEDIESSNYLCFTKNVDSKKCGRYILCLPNLKDMAAFFVISDEDCKRISQWFLSFSLITCKNLDLHPCRCLNNCMNYDNGKCKVSQYGEDVNHIVGRWIEYQGCASYVGEEDVSSNA